MQRFETDEKIWEYFGEDNYFVVPISKYVKKSGDLTFYGSFGKAIAEKYPTLPTRWGYYVDEGVLLPVHRFPENQGGLLGGIEREHYASAVSEELVYHSLLLIAEFTLTHPSSLVYLPGWLGGEEFEELHHKTLTSERVILLEGVEI